MRMKKILLLSAAGAALLSLFACTKSIAPTESTVQVEISVASFSPDTKAIKTGWTAGDKINIWFGDAYWTVLPQLTLTYSGSAWTASSVDESLLSATGTFKAVYEASNSLFNKAFDGPYAYFPLAADFQTSSMQYTARTYTPQICCSQDDIPYTYDSTTKKLSASIDDWTLHLLLQVVVSGLTGTPSRYALGGPLLYRYDALYYNETDKKITVSSGGRIGSKSSTTGWCGGIANADGVAFTFYQSYSQSTSADYLIYLYDTETEKMYEYTKKDVIIGFSRESVAGIKIPFSDFTETTP